MISFLAYKIKMPELRQYSVLVRLWIMEATQNDSTNTYYQKAQFYTDFNPAIPLPGIYSKEIVSDIHKRPAIKMFNVSLIIKRKIKYPVVGSYVMIHTQ